MNQDPFKEYLIQAEPNKRDKGYHSSFSGFYFKALADSYVWGREYKYSLSSI